MNTTEIKWVARKNGNMIDVSAEHADGSMFKAMSKAGMLWVGAEGETVEEAICEALLMVGVSYDEAFDTAISAKYTWE